MDNNTPKISILSLLLAGKNQSKLDMVEDGVYDITNIPRLFIPKHRRMILNDKEIAQVQEFLDNHGPDNIVVGNAYETDATILLASPPKEITTWRGGFNYGTVAVITDCPRDIMILAEND